MHPPTHVDVFLALAGASFVAVIGALSVNTYDWSVIIGIAILAADIPVLVGFSRWRPLYFRPERRHKIASHLLFVSMPAALLGISFILAHVHVICGILFAVSSGIACYFYLAHLKDLGQGPWLQPTADRRE